MQNVHVSIIEKMMYHNCCKIKVVGNSMEPNLHQGDMVEIIPADSVIINDIILYEIGDKRVLHRVVDIFSDIVITKGDNNNFNDGAISKEKIIGKMKHNEVKIHYEQNINIIFNFWNFTEFEHCNRYSKLLEIDIHCKPNTFYDDCFNVAVSPYAMEPIVKTELNSTERKICIHIGVPISDFVCDGFVTYSDFDLVCRSGSYISGYTLSDYERFMILYGEIHMLRG